MNYKNHTKLIELITKSHKDKLGKNKGTRNTFMKGTLKEEYKLSDSDLKKIIDRKNAVDEINDNLSAMKYHIDTLFSSGIELLPEKLNSALEIGRRIVTLGDNIEDGEYSETTVKKFREAVSEYKGNSFHTSLATIKTLKGVLDKIIATQPGAASAVDKIRAIR